MLREPPGTAAPTVGAEVWVIETASAAVRKGWGKTIKADPKGTARAYAYVRERPFSRYPGRCFPLRGKDQQGVWQYEVNATYRLRYAAIAGRDHALVVLYAGDYH